MKIKKVQVYRVQPPGDTWVWLAIESSNGLTGWGEVSGTGMDDAVAQEIQRMSDSLIGKDPRDVLGIKNELIGNKFPSFGSNIISSTAWSGIDQALWDLTSQDFELPLYYLMGGYGQNKIPLYANLNRAIRDNRSPEALKKQGQDAYRSGFSFVKCTPFDEITPESNLACLSKAWDRMDALISVVPISHIAMDCHHRFHRSTLAQFLDVLLDKGNPYWIEDPFPLDRWPDIEIFRKKHPGIRWATGETATGLQDLWEIIHTQSADILMPDVKYAGGVSVIKYMIPLAEARGLWMSLHNHTGPIATAFSAHLLTLGAHTLPLEFPWGVTSERAQSTTPMEPISDGYYHLSDKPGIGIKPNDKFLMRYGTISRSGEWIS